MNEKEKDYIDTHRYFSEVVLFNSQYTVCSPYADTTVVGAPDVVLRGALQSRNQFLGLDYLLNFRKKDEDMGFRMGLGLFHSRPAILASALRKYNENLIEALPLPKPHHVKPALSVVIEQRRSVRKYTGQALSLGDLATTLHLTQGVTGSLLLNEPINDIDRIQLHSNPSGGGLYSIKLLVAAWNVKDLKKGIYEYYPHSHSLLPVRDLTEEELGKFAAFADINWSSCNFVLIYVYQLFVNSHKYGDSGMAYAFIEAGECAQNAQLAATGMGFGGCDLGGYHKEYLEELIGLDGINEHVIHMTIFGWPGA